MKSRLTFFLVLCISVWLTGCKSKEKKEEAPPTLSKKAGVTAPAKPAVSQSVDVWDEPEAPAPSLPAVPADGDVLIDRYEKECPDGNQSAGCHAMRLQVERIFLNDLVGLRADGKEIDREWYRVAASAETPQLACIGLRELIYDKNRTTEDESLIVAALDSPFPEMRHLAFAANVPQIKELWSRAQVAPSSAWGTCVSDMRDREPGLKWAGGYPGARYRYFASNRDLRWFTTSDPVDKVLAYFKNQGKQPMTMQEMSAAEQAKFVAEANKISANPQPGGEQKLMELMQKMGYSTTWETPFRNMEGRGEIRYVMLSPKQAIAIFKDDILHATSVVAPRPQVIDFSPDLEKAKAEEIARNVYRY